MGIFKTVLNLPRYSTKSFFSTSVIPIRKEKTALVQILDNSNYKSLSQKLQKSESKEPLDIFARYILDLNIAVPKLSLENEKKIFPKTIRIFQRTEVGEIPSEIKFKRISKLEESVILSNWKDLLKETDQEAQKVGIIFDNSNLSNEDRLKKNLIGYWLSQDLPHIRLSCEIFHRLNHHLNWNDGEFSAKENKKIFDFVSKNGRDWAKLSHILKRPTTSILNQYDDHIMQADKIRKGFFTIDEDKILIKEMLIYNPNVLQDRKIEKQVLEKLSSVLDRKPKIVLGHWKGLIEPLLMRHKAGVLDTDFQQLIVAYMVENGLECVQDVDWKRVVELSQFKGTTPTYLCKSFDCGVRAAMQKYDLPRNKTTSSKVQEYLRERTQHSSKSKSKIEREETLIEFYSSLTKE